MIMSNSLHQTLGSLRVVLISLVRVSAGRRISPSGAKRSYGEIQTLYYCLSFSTSFDIALLFACSQSCWLVTQGCYKRLNSKCVGVWICVFNTGGGGHRQQHAGSMYCCVCVSIQVHSAAMRGLKRRHIRALDGSYRYQKKSFSPLVAIYITQIQGRASFHGYCLEVWIHFIFLCHWKQSNSGNLTSGLTMKSHLRSLVLSACWREPFSTNNFSQHDTEEVWAKLKAKERFTVCMC